MEVSSLGEMKLGKDGARNAAESKEITRQQLNESRNSQGTPQLVSFRVWN